MVLIGATKSFKFFSRIEVSAVIEIHCSYRGLRWEMPDTYEHARSLVTDDTSRDPRGSYFMWKTGLLSYRIPSDHSCHCSFPVSTTTVLYTLPR